MTQINAEKYAAEHYIVLPDQSEDTALAPPALQPLEYKELTQEEAVEENSSLPFSTDPIEAALPLILPGGEMAIGARRNAIDCLTAAIYYESAHETRQGRRAVAQVILNRVRHPAFPNTICSVIYQGSQRKTGCQFTFTCDGSLKRRPSRVGWDKSLLIAQAALSGLVEPSVGMATHYHADYVVPYWASSLSKIVQVGHHIFYRWRGNWGRRRAFRQTVSFDNMETVIFADIFVDLLGADAYTDDPFGFGTNTHGPSEAGPAPSPIHADQSMGAPRNSSGGGGPALSTHKPLTADDAAGTLTIDEQAGELIVE